MAKNEIKLTKLTMRIWSWTIVVVLLILALNHLGSLWFELTLTIWNIIFLSVAIVTLAIELFFEGRGFDKKSTSDIISLILIITSVIVIGGMAGYYIVPPLLLPIVAFTFIADAIMIAIETTK